MAVRAALPHAADQRFSRALAAGAVLLVITATFAGSVAVCRRLRLYPATG
jgi:hypothetical protein